MTPRDYLSALEKCGWLAAVPSGEQSRLKVDLAKAFEAASGAEYLCLASGAFDGECIEEDGPGSVCSYRGVLQEYAAASFGGFRPKRVIDRLDDESRTASVAFTLAGRRFSCQVPFEGDYFEDGVHDLVNEALAATNVRERFQILPSEDQVVYLTFVPPEVYRRAESAGLLPTPVSGGKKATPEENARICELVEGGDFLNAAKELIKSVGQRYEGQELDEAKAREEQRRRNKVK